MIAVSKLGLGFDSDVDMDEPEVEEGEAYSHQDVDDDDDENYDYDPTVDPDVDLSYIDEKLQDVLGHFQKDFEGVVTAENLGAKFGDYGSFLPAYQRAPAGSHVRSSARVHNHNLTTSLSKSHSESVHVLRRHEEASVSNVAKRTEEILSAQSVNESSRFEPEKNYGQSSDKNNLKAFAEVGSDNLSTLKMAELYSGLGLELSPSSLRESPIDIEGDCPHESPSTILQIMTSSLLHENLLLSPLTDYLINLTEKQKKFQREDNLRASHKVCGASPNVPGTIKSGANNFREKKSFQKVFSSPQLKNFNDDNTQKDNGILLKKEIDSNNLACGKLDKNTANGESIDINVRLKKTSRSKKVKAVFSSETESNVSKGRAAEKADPLRENAKIQEDNDLQLFFSKEHASFGRENKLKRDQGHNERDNSVPKKEKGNPKTNGESSRAVNIYKDLFGEMELDIDLDTEKNCSNGRGIDDMAADKSQLAPNNVTEKRLNAKKIVGKSMSGANMKSVSNAASIGGVVGPLVQLCQVPLASEVEQKYDTKETNVHDSRDDRVQLEKSSKKKHQASISNKSLNGISSSPLGKEVQVILSKPNIAEEHVHTQIEKERLYEQHSSEGEGLLSENNSKRAHDQNGSRASKKIRMDSVHCHEEVGEKEREREKLVQINGSYQIKSGKKSSLRAKEENGRGKSETNKGKAKIYDSSKEPMDCTESYEQIQSAKSGKIETKLVVKKESVGEGSKESTRNESRAKSEETNVSGVKFDPASSHEDRQIPVNIDEKPSKSQLRGEVSEKGRSHSLPPSGRSRNETETNHCQKNESVGDIALEAPKPKKSLNNNGLNLRQSITNGHKSRDKDVPSLAKRDSSSHAISNALKEAKDLKHLADRLKSTGSSAESTGLYFQAALKFLHGASLLESSSGEGAKESDAIQSLQIYSSTGKLCGFCAHEYEKSKDMATASLAYKCMEVAYMRVVYSSRVRASRDRLVLQAASLPGESPLSSASDVDNLNNSKSDKTKGIVSSPQVGAASNHVMSAGNRPSFTRLLNHAQDVNFAMEASRKCKIAFTAAQRIEETKCREEEIISIKRALDFNFQDMEGLLRLVRLAMEAISR